ncbi:MAG: DNA polymerase III subunit alpha [Bacteroidales bacterium]|jgi:DNA polymerase-3 subunit alpha|nr:DNA polymerase III subunit alpha [Bacteroidales bacterium]
MFTHLHVHTQYSILDGQADVAKILERAKELGMEALAITDHGSMFGVFDFHSQAKKMGVKPIIGCEFYVATGSRFEKKNAEESGSNHLILLAKNAQGYQNLCRLCSLGYKEGFYYRPRIDKELLQKYSEGLICLSACLGGEIPRLLNADKPDRAEKAVQEFLDIFGEDFYLEIQNHGWDDQKRVNPLLVELSRKYNIKLVASNDVHFVNKTDFTAHQILVCLNTGKKFGEQKQMVYTGEEFLKSAEEMAALFPEYPEAIVNTQEIATKIESFEIKRETILPHFPLPESFNSEMDYLRKITLDNAKERWGDPIPEEVSERLNFELDKVEKMGFPGYFLIVWDFIKKAREMSVLVGPGRGSAAGSAIAYALKITNVDPIKYNLLFERFLNPDRISLPDMDIDFDDEGREKVIQYVVEKYGKERVAQIVTLGTMAAKNSIKDVARVFDLPLNESNRLTNLVPDRPGTTLKDAFRESADLTKEKDSSNEIIRKTLQHAVELEGSIRNTGVHACGMIISPEDLMDVVPVSIAKGTDMPVVQYEGKVVEDAGLLKMDFLGLSTLNIIKNTLKNIKLRHNIDIDIETIPLDDTLTYELFSKGETASIFQFESDGMRKWLMALKPNRFEDLIAMNALYRPGPMDYIPSFVKRKHGQEAISYDLQDMDEFLEETYGITVYQEQVMLLSQKLANFTKGDADTLRKAMGKKQMAVLEKMSSKFTEGCKANGHDEKICQKIWKDWEAFAHYAFNKSHSTCYAYIAYQTAYLKAHYPAEFMAASLTNDLANISKISFLMDECKRMKIPLLSPDVNESQADFTVNAAGAIRFGLAAIKGVGGFAVESLIEERNANGLFTSIFDFAKRINLQKFNKRCFEGLAKAGAFDCFKNVHRAQFFFQNPDDTLFLDSLVSFANKYQTNKNSSQTSLFDDDADGVEVADPQIPYCEPWPKIVELQNEKDVTGFFISGHPLDDYKFEQKHFANCTIPTLKGDLKALQNKDLRFIAMITNAEHLISKKGTNYGRVTFQDFEDSIDFTLFTDDYKNFRNDLIPYSFVFVEAKVDKRFVRYDERQRAEAEGRTIEDTFELKLKKISLLENLMDKKSKTIQLRVSTEDVTTAFTDTLKTLAMLNPGQSTLDIQIFDTEHQCELNMPSRNLKVQAKPFVDGIFEKCPSVSVKIN